MVDKTYTQDQVDLVKMAAKVDNIEKTVTKMSNKLDADYVTKDELRVLRTEFEIIQRLVYGVVTILLSGVIIAIGKLVIIG